MTSFSQNPGEEINFRRQLRGVNFEVSTSGSTCAMTSFSRPSRSAIVVAGTCSS